MVSESPCLAFQIAMQNRFVKICLFALLTIFCSSAGCTVKYIDKVTIFEIRGEVYDNESQWPIENVAVQFMDTGYDYARSQKPLTVTIGHSDADGAFLARFNYYWRYKDTTLQNPPQKTFEVVLTHQDYAPKRFQFQESDLQQNGMRLEINLEKIYMLPKKTG